jgi:hypothetical protein
VTEGHEVGLQLHRVWRPAGPHPGLEAQRAPGPSRVEAGGVENPRPVVHRFRISRVGGGGGGGGGVGRWIGAHRYYVVTCTTTTTTTTTTALNYYYSQN